MEHAGSKRTDVASRVIKAPAGKLYRAFVDPQALIAWLPPRGMTARIDVFEPREGGTYRMTLTYERPDHSTRGKTSDDADVVQGQFLELVEDQRIVQLVRFESEDPAFAGAMKTTWSLVPVSGGTEVTILCEDVPAGIRKEDHDTGMRSTLSNLAAFVE